MKSTLLSFLFLSSALGQVVVNIPVGVDIPDNSSSGLASVQVLSLADHQIGRVTVQLQIGATPGDNVPWNGDYFAFLEHNGAVAVLLNRPGRAANLASDPGYGGSGFNITLEDGAPNIHTSGTVLGAPLAGSWAPDGRGSAPGFGITSDPVNSALATFNAADPNGTWRLFIADLGAGNQAQLVSWGLTITPVPEPTASVFITSLALLTLTGLKSARFWSAAALHRFGLRPSDPPAEPLQNKPKENL